MRIFNTIKIGDKFGRLEVIGLPFKKYNVSKCCNGRYHAPCRCTCGNTKDVMLTYLVSGTTASCGCYRSQLKQKGSFAKNGIKKCSVCKKIKYVKEFSVNKRCKDKLNCHCRFCERSKSLLRRYNITIKEYIILLKKQQNGCAVCGSKKPARLSFAVDHCHKTNQTRGLLCRSCNTLLGKLGDEEQKIKTTCEKFVNYLSQTKGL